MTWLANNTRELVNVCLSVQWIKIHMNSIAWIKTEKREEMKKNLLGSAAPEDEDEVEGGWCYSSFLFFLLLSFLLPLFSLSLSMSAWY